VRTIVDKGNENIEQTFFLKVYTFFSIRS